MTDKFAWVNTMGIIQTKGDIRLGIRNSIKTNNNKAEVFDPRAPEPELTTEDAILLKKTWNQLKDEITKVGIVTFMK